MDSAASSVSTNASGVLMSGSGAPSRTAIPIDELARSMLVSGRTRPWAVSSFRPAWDMIRTSKRSPRSSLAGIESGAPPVDAPVGGDQSDARLVLESRCEPVVGRGHTTRRHDGHFLRRVRCAGDRPLPDDGEQATAAAASTTRNGNIRRRCTAPTLRTGTNHHRIWRPAPPQDGGNANVTSMLLPIGASSSGA